MESVLKKYSKSRNERGLLQLKNPNRKQYSNTVELAKTKEFEVYWLILSS
ncbi:MAG: hypothetical protein IPF63_14180 [Bacteroidetes bacterium]|nr:hypothetical protein [Bacteroidota bacterium]